LTRLLSASCHVSLNVLARQAQREMRHLKQKTCHPKMKPRSVKRVTSRGVKLSSNSQVWGRRRSTIKLSSQCMTRVCCEIQHLASNISLLITHAGEMTVLHVTSCCPLTFNSEFVIRPTCTLAPRSYCGKQAYETERSNKHDACTLMRAVHMTLGTRSKEASKQISELLVVCLTSCLAAAQANYMTWNPEANNFDAHDSGHLSFEFLFLTCPCCARHVVECNRIHLSM
jgi:hypothetical protein